MSANECPKHTAFTNACSNAHTIKHLAAKFGLDAQMQCNKLDAINGKNGYRLAFKALKLSG